MDVQAENAEPPPAPESQPSGKMRKGFKLFGKRKPGNIFSIRSKSEGGNNKSPLQRSKTLDVPDSAANNDSSEDQERDRSQGDEEQAEEEPLGGEDGVYAAAPARTSISSASSAKSLGFLSILRGGRRGAGDRKAQTVSQHAGRHRRGIKGLFGNVKFRSKDKDEKEEKEEVPPSPLLMSSRSNSVEIIKEDLTLTPKSQPRSLNSPGTDSSDPTAKSQTAQDSSATTPSKTASPGGLESQPPMVPGDTSLSTLLADISSLLTFDSISGGDIMADVEAEWGKASRAVTPVVPDASPTYTSFSKPMSSFKPTTPTHATQPSSPMKPSSIITTLAKTTTLTTPTVKSTTEMASNGSVLATKPSTNTFSSPVMSSPPITMKTTLGVTSATTALPNTETKAPSTKLGPELTETPKTTSSMSSFGTTAPAKTTPFTPKFDLSSSLPSSSFNKFPVTVSVTSSVTAQPSPLAPLMSSKVTTTESSSSTVSVSTTRTAAPASALFTAGIVNENSSFSNTQASSVLSTASKSQAAPVYLNGTLGATSLLSKSSPSPALSQNIQPSSLPVSKEAPLSISQPKLSAAPSEMPSFLSKTPIPTSQISASSPQIPLASTTAPPPPSHHTALSQTSSCPISTAPLSRDGSGKKRESDPCSVQSPKSPEPLHPDSHDRKRTSQGHSAAGLSKIPIVGGGRVGKIPVRVTQPTEEEAIRDTVTTPPEDPTPHLNSHDGGSKDKVPEVAKQHSQEEQQQQTHVKTPTCSPRDSKIPVKHGSQIPQAKTKIPVSKVPVRRAGGKPTAQSGSMQIRK